MGPQERVPCPVCGGAIHPVAGRCKHCKTDLVARRTGKPQAPSALPSLGNRTTNDRPVAGPAMPGRWKAGGALPAVDPATATFSLGMQLPSARQVLPARPTGSLPIAPSTPAWPVIVIALSALAIVLSIGALAF